ncbi:dipeptidylpeptidase, partial [Rhizophlyctis rosea]
NHPVDDEDDDDAMQTDTPTALPLHLPSSTPLTHLAPRAHKDDAHTTALIKSFVPVPELFSFVNGDGVRIYGMVYKPFGWRKGVRYPTLLRIYGGPNVQVVNNEWKGGKWGRVFLGLKFGFVIVMIDSRGSYDRGLEFESHIQHRMGRVELRDQIEGLLYLALRSSSSHPPTFTPTTDLQHLWTHTHDLQQTNQLPDSFVDLGRVGVTGWSYGGYLSLMAVVQFPGIFRMALSGAPVTCWELYDTGYTERYMGVLKGGGEGEGDGGGEGEGEEERRVREGYRLGSVLEYVDRFPDCENKLLLVHGLIDENVHFKNTEVLVERLVKLGKPHQVQVYPGERHGLRGANVVEHFETLMFWWFGRYL